MLHSAYSKSILGLTGIALVLAALLLASCTPDTNTTEIVVLSTPIITSTVHVIKTTPSLPLEITPTPTSQPITPASSPTPTPAPTDLASPPSLGFRITYVTFEENDQNEIMGTKMWVLVPPYENPHLLYSSPDEEDGRGVIFFSAFPWSHNDQRIAFSRLIGDHKVTVSTLDVESGEIEQLVEPVSAGNYQILLDRFSWSLDDRWFYVSYYDGFAVTAEIVDTTSRESYFLEYKTQDELLSWSPAIPDQFAYISRPDFPEPGGETIHIGEAGKDEPLISITGFQDYTLLRGFSWSPDSQKAVIQAISSEGTPAYLLLDFQNEEWEVLLHGQDIPVTKYWSPDGNWLVFSRYDRGLFLLNLEEPDHLSHIAASDSAFPIAWLPDNSMLVFRDASGVFGVFPDTPENPFIIQDFSSILQEIGPYFQIDLIDLEQ